MSLINPVCACLHMVFLAAQTLATSSLCSVCVWITDDAFLVKRIKCSHHNSGSGALGMLVFSLKHCCSLLQSHRAARISLDLVLLHEELLSDFNFET